MKVFLSWSGEKSKSAAELLANWLPTVLQSIQPWFSASDIRVGSRWINELTYQLNESKVGIICLTPENLKAPWLLFEAGALSKNIENSFIIPYLIGFKPSELSGPLVQFQSVTTSKEENYKLLQTLNRLSDNSVNEEILKRTFEVWWPSFESKIKKLEQTIEPSYEDYKVENIETTSKTSDIPDSTLILLKEIVEKLSSVSKEEKIQQKKDRVFIVHGHNELIKNTVARLIEKLDLTAIILNEQPNQGQTIMEKFESNSDSDFAIVLMTGDDVGSEKDNEKLIKRARQNVVFELGYFTAKLGRKRIAVLYENGVEIPSDFNGIVYIPIDDSGMWKYIIAKELKTAGLNIDMNNVI